MLRLPIKSAGLSAGCNFAVAHVLLAAVGGISTTLYGTGANHYQRSFRDVLVKYYPWDSEAKEMDESSKREVAEALWTEFRGPITHHMGLWTTVSEGQRKLRDRGYAVKFKRMSDDGDGLRESYIELIESSDVWPFESFQETMAIRDDSKVLKLKRFYWGIRQTVVRLTRDRGLMGQAERFLSHVS